MHGIIQIDMHIRDERVLAFIVERAKQSGGWARLSHNAIADEFKCHRLTARAIVARLASARLIEIERAGKRGGYFYKVIDGR